MLTPGIALAWLFGQRFAGPTEPLWTASDLPPLPAEADNGWVVIDEAMPRVPFDDVTEQRLDELLDPDSALGARITVFDQASASLRTESARHASVIATVERALARARFADACPLDWETMCPSLELMDMQLLIAVRSFAIASEGRWVEALAFSTSALRAWLDYAATARRATSMAVATVGIGRAVALIEDLVALAQRAELPPASWAATRRDIRRLLEQQAPLNRRRTVRCEYMTARSALDELIASSRGRTSAFRIDARATSTALDNYFSALDAHIEDPSRPAPRVPSRNDDVTPWWVYNPIGDVVLDNYLYDYRPRLEGMHRLEGEIDAHVESVLSALPPDP